MEEIVIFGLGELAQIANYYFKIDSNFKVVAFTVDREFINDSHFEGLPLIPFDELLSKYPPSKFKLFIAVGYTDLNRIREKKYNETKKMGYELVSYISSKCTYLTQYQHGENCFIAEHNSIHPFVKIGNNVILWTGNTIAHHSIIHDHNYLSGHIVVAGQCVLNSNSFFGINAMIGNQVEIGGENIIGAGSIILKNTGFGEVYVPVKSTKLEIPSSKIKL